MSVWKGRWSISWLKSCTERVCIMNVRVVCFPASSACIGTEPAADIAEENAESGKTDCRQIIQRLRYASAVAIWFIAFRWSKPSTRERWGTGSAPDYKHRIARR